MNRVIGTSHMTLRISYDVTDATPLDAPKFFTSTIQRKKVDDCRFVVTIYLEEISHCYLKDQCKREFTLAYYQLQDLLYVPYAEIIATTASAVVNQLPI